MSLWRKALEKTRGLFTGAIRKIGLLRRKVDAETLEDLETSLIRADVAPRLAAEVVGDLGKACRGTDLVPSRVLVDLLAKSLGPQRPFTWDKPASTRCILMVGINGSGKTTTCAKLAWLAKQKGRKAILGAGDTFRAAGTEQLRLWADRLGVEVVSGRQGSDAAAVAYDALDAAIARNADYVIIDTAGRMHTKAHLMEELRKLTRALKKRLPDAPHEVWIVLDASIGQNAINQARVFHEAVPLTGIVMSKLDGSSKAGFIFSIQRELNVPILFMGLGEQAPDLSPFDPAEFCEALVGVEEDDAPEGAKS
ncbi:MAG: signal recognition particle-docking protein FtsY [Kiritimatiellia bacterium]